MSLSRFSKSAVLGGALVAVAATTAGAATPGGNRSGSLAQDVAAIHRAGAVGAIAEQQGNRAGTARAGQAKLGSDRPVPENANFRAGSTTKTFVGTVVLQLVGAGRLSLDDTVDHWLPGVVSGNGNDGRKVTVRELLQHTSGIYDYGDDAAFAPRLGSAAGYLQNRFNSYSLEQLVAVAMKHKPNFAAGTSWSYSNTNYTLAAMIIQKVTGHSWTSELRRRITEPLNLRHTYVPGDVPFIAGPHADGYQQFDDAKRPTDVTTLNTSFAGSSGSIISSTADLNRFFRALVGGRLLAPAQLREMEKTVAVPDDFGLPAGSRDGLGLFRVPLSCGGYYWGHPGDAPGYQTVSGVRADGRRSVVVSSTGSGTIPVELGDLTLVNHALCR
ncbi:MAG TPA: serine hydrolase domain-containing protein [Mycobacteriales bacterium]|nr:serine hydrolase domain-containing protein [Mycobacteriales bacterium]